MTQQGTKLDAVIIGAGPGGLSAGIALARRGRRVLIAEKNAVPGGNCTAYKAGDYTFDLAVHQLSGIADDGMCGRVLREYGIEGKVEFRRVDPFLTVQMPDRSYRVRAGRDAFRDELLKDFPEDRADIDRMMTGLDNLKKDSLIAQRLLYGGNPVVNGLMADTVDRRKLLTFPYTFATGLALMMPFTADTMLKRWVRNPRLRAVVHASWIYLGLPPERISGVMQNVFLSMQYTEGGYYPVGGSQRLADALADAFRGAGGTLLLGSPVKRILTEGGRACGIELADGSRHLAGIVISGADSRHTYGELLGGEAAPARFMRKLRRMSLSLGPFRVCLGLDYDVAKHGMENHEYILFPGYDHGATFSEMEKGRLSALSLYSPTSLSPGLAPAGHSTLILTDMLPWHCEPDWRGRREQLADEMVAMAERRLLPGLSKHVKMRKLLDPEELSRLTNVSEGAMYGWANTPWQVLMHRLSMISPVKGLYHAGHWTRLGTGVTTSIISGWMLVNGLEGGPLRRLRL